MRALALMGRCECAGTALQGAPESCLRLHMHAALPDDYSSTRWPLPTSPMQLHTSHQPSRLAQLLTACTIGMALSTAAAQATAAAAAAAPGTPRASQEGQQPMEAEQPGSGNAQGAPVDLALVLPCWGPEGGLGAKLAQALASCGNLLAEGCKVGAYAHAQGG